MRRRKLFQRYAGGILSAAVDGLRCADGILLAAVNGLRGLFLPAAVVA